MLSYPSVEAAQSQVAVDEVRCERPEKLGEPDELLQGIGVPDGGVPSRVDALDA
jgi:hypothetical protein